MTGVTFKWKDYRIEGPGRYKTMTLPTHEFIRRFLMHVLPKGFHRIRHYGLFANGNRAANIARARELLAAPSPLRTARDVRGRSARRTARAAASVPLLRWPHDHHRDLRARLRAEAPPHARSGSDQDRHLMMPSPPIHRPQRRPPFLLALGQQRPRSRRSTRSARTRTVKSVCATRFPLVHPDTHAHASRQSDRIDRFDSNLLNPTPRPNPHSARGTAGCPTPRDFVPWRFSDAGRQQRVDGFVIPASENLHNTCDPLVHPDTHAHASRKSDRIRRLTSTSSTLTPRPNPHSAGGTLGAPHPAISCLGAFRTLAAAARG